ncbi:MAG: lactate racemase domain-containing protein [Candidatus Aureabacteria bacterium]|nr:lactate racemase domain-containing protein [Candidatus Auribacterota bacterium]
MRSEDIRLHYGDQVLSGFIPQEWIDQGRFLPLRLTPRSPAINDPAGAMASAFENPIGDIPPFGELVKRCLGRGKIAILVDDYTRPNLHTRLLLPLLLDLLKSRYGVNTEKVRAVVCTGTHRLPTGAELKKVVGEEMLRRIEIVSHECDKNLAEAGEVDGRTIRINREAFEADLIIALTDVDNHYFAGVAGGPKSFCPGICDRETITSEHLRMFSDTGFAENVALGVLDGNPVYESKKKIVSAIIGALKKRGREVYGLAAIIDAGGALVYLRGGEIFSVHRAAAKKLDSVWTVSLPERPETVIAGAGSLGINLYQAGKAVHAAFTAVRPGGLILAAAPCPDRFGNEEYRRLMAVAVQEMNKHSDAKEGVRAGKLKVLEIVRGDFKIGTQKAVDVFRILEHVGPGRLHFIQDGLRPEDKTALPFTFFGDPGTPPAGRLKHWVLRYASGKTIAVIDNPGFLIRIGEN